MTALVVSMQQSLGGPSFGDYHRRDEDSDESDEGGCVAEQSSSSSNAGVSPLSSSATASEWTNSYRSHDVVHPSPMDGVPRSRYSLDDEEDVTTGEEAVPQMQSPPMTRSHSQDSEEYVMVENMENESNNNHISDDSIPSLNDMDMQQQQQQPDTALLWGAQPVEGAALLESDPFAPTDMNDDDASIIDAPVVEAESSVMMATQLLPFGGLNNMGNTCYLNSALQMVASLDEFSAQIRKHIPATELAALEKNSNGSSETLRLALLNVLERLGRGETFRPEAFKSKVDERSPLFIGYLQQDAHEFLTTLLDLLDEDYKKKLPSEETDDEEMCDAVPVTDEEKGEDDAKSITPDSAEANQEDDQEMYDVASPVKKQRLDEGNIDVALPDLEVPAISNSQSFKDLEFSGIESLLYGDSAASAASPSNTSNPSKDEGPRCKLVGGRMNTVGAALTRWEEDNNVDASPADAKALADGAGSATAEDEAKTFSPVDDYFTTEVRVCLTCDSCKYRRSHAETYFHLSLEIGPTIGSIEEGLRAFFKPEKRDIKCEKCFCETALQTTEITKLPRALLFHLKRFIVDVSPDYTSISYRKDQSPVSFEPLLQLDEHSGALGEVVATDEVILPGNARYGIRSVVNHIGSSASCGHYTADACRCSKEEGREWIRFNDSYVTKITQAEAVDSAASTAYMIMYELEPNE